MECKQSAYTSVQEEVAGSYRTVERRVQTSSSRGHLLEQSQYIGN